MSYARTIKIFISLITLLIIAFYLLDGRAQRNWFIYASVLFAHFFLLSGIKLRDAFSSWPSYAFLTLILAPLLSLFWSESLVSRDIRQHIVAAYCLIAIFYGFANIRSFQPEYIERLKAVMLWSGNIVGALIILLWIIIDSAEGRLGDWLGLANPVHASIMLLTSTLPLILNVLEQRQRKIMLILCIIPLTFTLLAGARMALLAYGAITVLMFIFYSKAINLRYMTSIVLAIGLLILALFTVDFLREVWLSRGLSYRLEIWEKLWTNYQGCNLWIGCGIGTNYTLTMNDGLLISRAHSIFAATLYSQGVLGLLLFTSVMITCVVLGIKKQAANSTRGWSLMLAFALLSNLTSGDQILVRGELFWLYFWLPVIAILASQGTLKLRKASI